MTVQLIKLVRGETIEYKGAATGTIYKFSEPGSLQSVNVKDLKDMLDYRPSEIKMVGRGENRQEKTVYGDKLFAIA